MAKEDENEQGDETQEGRSSPISRETAAAAAKGAAAGAAAGAAIGAAAGVAREKRATGGEDGEDEDDAATK